MHTESVAFKPSKWGANLVDFSEKHAENERLIQSKNDNEHEHDLSVITRGRAIVFSFDKT